LAFSQVLFSNAAASFVHTFFSMVHAGLSPTTLSGEQTMPHGPADLPFVRTECAPTAQAASTTRTNIAVFQLFPPPEPGEQHSPPLASVGPQVPSPCWSIPSFVSISLPQNQHLYTFFQNNNIGLLIRIPKIFVHFFPILTSIFPFIEK
jgi:hypothetical protein